MGRSKTTKSHYKLPENIKIPSQVNDGKIRRNLDYYEAFPTKQFTPSGKRYSTWRYRRKVKRWKDSEPKSICILCLKAEATVKDKYCEVCND